MKIILKKDVPKIGGKNSVVEVSDGYATNFLIPKKLAERATEQKIKRMEEQKQMKEEKTKEEMDLKEKEIKELAGKTIGIKEKASEKGHLFKGIDAKEVVKKLRSAGYKNIKERDINLEKPIKETGDSNIKLSSGNVESEFELKIEEDNLK